MRLYRDMFVRLGRARWYSWLTIKLLVPIDRFCYRRSGGRFSLLHFGAGRATAALWPQLLEIYPTWDAYTARTDRSFRASFLERA